VDALGDYSVGLGLKIQALNLGSTALGGGLFTEGEFDVLLGTKISSSGGNNNILGGKNIDATSDRGLALGTNLKLGADGSHVIGIGFNGGNPLTSGIPTSLSVGYRSTVPTLFVGPNTSTATDGSGKVGIYTSSPISTLDVRGNSLLLTQPGVTPITLGNSQFAAIGESGGTPGGTVTGCDLYGFRAQSNTSNFVNLGILEPTGAEQPVLTYGEQNLLFLYDDASGTAGCGSKIIQFLTPSSSAQVEVFGDLIANNVSPSDMRFKRNINEISDPMTMISQLRGTTYEMRQDEFPERNFKAGTQYGFIAQEIKEVIPTAVIKDSRGYYGVNYSAVVPLLTEGVKAQQAVIETQQATIDTQAEQISALEDRLSRIEALLAQNNDQPQTQPVQGPALYQNVPNPSDGNTMVPFYLPETVREARILVVDISTGLTMAQEVITERGDGSVALNLQTLQNGTYAYVLLIEGKRQASKRLIIQR
jgi:hypothetical protein